MNNKNILNLLASIAIVGLLNIADNAKASIISSVQSYSIPCGDSTINFDKTLLVCYGSIGSTSTPFTLLDLKNFHTFSTFQYGDIVNNVVIAPDNNNVFISKAPKSSVWNLSTGAHKNIAHRAEAISPDGKNAYFYDSQAIYSLNINNLERDTVANLLFQWKDSLKESLIVTPNGKILIGKSKNDISLWDLQNEKWIKNIKADMIDVSADSQILAGAYNSNDIKYYDNNDKVYEIIRIWNINTGKVIKNIPVTLKTTGHKDARINSLAISPNKKLIAYTFIGTYSPIGLGVVDLNSGKLLFRTEKFPDSEYKLGLTLRGFTKDSKKMILANGETIVVVTLK